MANATTTAHQGKSRRQSSLSDVVYYLIEIFDWEWRYSFSVSKKPDRGDPYDEFPHISISGELVEPTTVKTKSVRITLVSKRELNHEERLRHSPQAVGTITNYRGEFEAVVLLPLDTFPHVLTALATGRIKSAMLESQKLIRGRGTVRYFSLDMDDAHESDR